MKNIKLSVFGKTLFALNLLLFSQFVIASDPIENTLLASSSNVLLALSSACKACIKSYTCDRSNKVCQKNCQANLYTDSIDLESCSQNCTSSWSKCEVSAKKACDSYYCSDKESGF